jgi:hypothetical protein
MFEEKREAVLAIDDQNVVGSFGVFRSSLQFAQPDDRIPDLGLPVFRLSPKGDRRAEQLRLQQAFSFGLSLYS